MADLRRETVYQEGGDGASCVGVRLGGLGGYMSGRVHDRYYDVDGWADVLADLPDTGFDAEALIRNDAPGHEQAQHRIAEALCECYLHDYCKAELPVPGARTLKNPRASQAGADLVGFSLSGGKARFLFGEVKASGERRSPPSVASGMAGQLEAIRDSDEKKYRLVYWLRLQIGGDDPRFAEAAAALSGPRPQVTLAGLLVRDTEPDRRDLAGALGRLRGGAREGAVTELTALYLEIPLPRLEAAMERGGDAG